MRIKIGFLAILAFAVVGLGTLAYFLTANLDKNKKEVVSDIQTVDLSSQSDSDDVEDIESDLEETDFEQIDRELVEIEAEIKASE